MFDPILSPPPLLLGGSGDLFTNNEGPAVYLYYASGYCSAGLPTNYFPTCQSAYCFQQWLKPSGTTTAIPPPPTQAPTRPPTPAPTVKPPYAMCGAGSPLSTFFTGAKVVFVSNSAELTTALDAATGTTIIQLAAPGTYTLTKTQTISSNRVCIQVGRGK